MSINRAPFNALVDDDGSGQVGTVWNKAQIAGVLLDPIDQMHNPGAFTPYVSSSNGGSPIHGAQNGNYQKSDRTVTVWIEVTINGLGSLAAGNVMIGGLPFASNPYVAFLGGFVATYYAGLTAAVPSINGFVRTNETRIELMMGGAGAAQALPTSYLSGNAYFILFGAYLIG